MAHHQTGRALLILFTFQLFIVSLYANPQTFGPLIRDRAIRDRQQTSEEDLNANIERIYRKDFKTAAPPKEHSTDEVEPSPTELISRSNAGSTTRPRRPIENNEQNAMVYVIRDSDGKLVPKFAEPSSIATTPRSASKPDPPLPNEKNGMFVLKLSTPSNQSLMEVEDPKFEDGSYPSGYPIELIDNILKMHKGYYEDVFEKTFKREPLTTRVNSESDKYLCASETRTEYPTSSVDNVAIVNVKGFYQPVVYEMCLNNGSTCSKSNTSAKYKLICLQTYRYYKMFVAPIATSSEPDKFKFIDVRLPACCKCAQVPEDATMK
ncbi:uncharacterized protein LOC125766138 [Anopheles funestus]|uniref:uncharacterized protein LOC125766138 n=1 Tax=Anopheles funestus TaxID=62324 RepID=UPI0020C6D322|nr:uncharacterized protein LOC125766138 [Anopheles funestus]